MYYGFTHPDMPEDVRNELYRNLWLLADIHSPTPVLLAENPAVIEDEEENDS